MNMCYFSGPATYSFQTYSLTLRVFGASSGVTRKIKPKWVAGGRAPANAHPGLPGEHLGEGSPTGPAKRDRI